MAAGICTLELAMVAGIATGMVCPLGSCKSTGKVPETGLEGTRAEEWVTHKTKCSHTVLCNKTSNGKKWSTMWLMSTKNAAIMFYRKHLKTTTKRELRGIWVSYCNLYGTSIGLRALTTNRKAYVSINHLTTKYKITNTIAKNKNSFQKKKNSSGQNELRML